MFGTRLTVELKKAKLESDPNFFLFPDEDLKTWRAIMLGPPDSPYEDGAYYIRLNITNVDAINQGLSDESAEGLLLDQDIPPQHPLGHRRSLPRHSEDRVEHSLVAI